MLDYFKHTAALLSNPERRYLVHALGNELPLTVDAGEGAIPRHLLQCVRNITRRRGAAICRVGTCEIVADFYWSETIRVCDQVCVWTACAHLSKPACSSCL